MYSSRNYFFDGPTSDYLSSFQTDCLTSNLDLFDASVSLYEGSDKQKCLAERVYYSSADAVSRLCPSRDPRPPPTRPDPAPGCDPCAHDWYLDSRREAKRARVENIIKGMSSISGLSESTPGSEEPQEHAAGCRSDHDAPVTSGTGACTDLRGEFGSAACMTQEGWKRLANAPQAKTGGIELMTDVLKYELSRAVSRSVDSIFKNASPGDAGAPQSPRVWSGGSLSLQAGGGQTEALSLVVPKPARERGSGLAGPPAPTPGPRKNARQHLQAKPKVSARSLRSPSAEPTSPHPHRIKGEPDVPSNYLYPLNEGLTTNHLKKAKLMFFYTRYPSSHVLKACFHDVKLIKWFSNFREFYYIQMEKFARQALAQGAADVTVQAVERESQLFRALNTHYNKANDYQVPQRFLEVAAITLREFYSAISKGEDRDPSWKKAIYKVICKLDADVPAEFKGQRPG